MARMKTVRLVEGEMSRAKFRQIIAGIRQRAAEEVAAPVNEDLFSFVGKPKTPRGFSEDLDSELVREDYPDLKKTGA